MPCNVSMTLESSLAMLTHLVLSILGLSHCSLQAKDHLITTCRLQLH